MNFTTIAHPLIAGLGFILVDPLRAQTFTTLHSFTGGSDGANPQAGLIISANTLYGTAASGGTNGNGTVFKVSMDGSDFAILHSFAAGGYNSSYDRTNSDGAVPSAGLLLSGNKLYGTTEDGGIPGKGAVFKINTDGTGFTNLYFFSATSTTYPRTNSDGTHPQSRLVLWGNTLYGMATFGGPADRGTIFAIRTDGSDFTNLHSFTGGSDGGDPVAELVLSNNTLYGTASSGGNWANGTLFAIHTDGTGFTNLYSFTAHSSGNPPYTNSDGSYPQGVLVLLKNKLYGTTPQCGGADNGTVFAVNIDGTGFTNLHDFSPTISYSNNDGARPDAGLTSLGNTLYGTTENGGSSGYGAVFAVNTDGTGFTTLHNFTAGSGSAQANSDGSHPLAGLLLSGRTLYGTAFYGGSSGAGAVFSLSFAPQLTIIPCEANVVLRWPTNYGGFDYAGFTLQSTTNLVSPAWTTNSPAPVAVNGLNTVTNPVSGTQQFFRLSR